MVYRVSTEIPDYQVWQVSMDVTVLKAHKGKSKAMDMAFTLSSI